MGWASQARRIAVAAAYGGGALGAAGMILLGVLISEARLARRTVGEPTTSPPVADGLYDVGVRGEAGPGFQPLLLALLGDSSAAGLGVDLPEQTPGALLAAGLSEIADRPVRLLNVAKVGARSADLLGQVRAVEERLPDVAVIMIGANDVTHRVRPVTSVRQLSVAVRLLRATGAEIVVGTCPDLGTIEPIAQPLRLLARRWSRTLAAAQTIAVVEAGARSVSLADLLGPEFAAAPRELFSADRFHPSASGYARVVSVVLPSVAAALSLGPREDDEERPVLTPGEGVGSLAAAAAQAAEEPGTEVSRTEVGGREAGLPGRWVVLRHRIRRFTRWPAGPQPEQLVR
jgi:lysophospholipase L1-like esterase